MLPFAELLDLSDQAALVTGGANGIGRGIALRLASAGANVLVTDLDEAEGREVAELTGGAFVRADGASPDDAARVVAHCVDRFGGIDILVNNAGIFPACDALQTTPELWRKVMALNLDGAFFHAQAAARWMVEHERRGSIVSVASIDAFHPTGNLVHYDASKAGVVMMTRSLAAELGRYGIRVNAVAPGGVRTPGADAVKQRFAEQLGTTTEVFDQGFVRHTPLGRMGEPDDIARAVLFMASPLAAYVTGETLVVDGGYLLG